MKKLLIITALILIAFFFYWFQFRPAQIKHDCSWVEVHQNAIPASLGVTIQEVEASKKDHPECNNAVGFANRLNCAFLIKEYQAPQPAQPAKNWWRATYPTEYQFCLHDKGL